MTDNQFEQAAAIMTHYGAEHQKDILIEECAELIQAVEKTRRGILTEDKPAYTYDMISEMADVQIMLWQFESVMTAYSRQCLEDEIQRKLRRQLDRISEEVEGSA
jgi:NTP pyrophosphatase (non-canonical NTP hydrolase)